MPHSVGAFLKGVGIADVKLDSNNHLLVYLDNGKILDAGQVPASDDALDATSERPVQNKIITAELDRIVNTLLAEAVSNITTLQQTKVDKISGKGLSTKDFTSAHEAKLSSLHNYDDTTLRAELTALSNRLTALVGGNANEAINSFNEIIAFLKGVEDSDSLNGILAGIGTRIAAAEARITAVEVKQREIEGAIADYDAQIESLGGRVDAQYNEINLVKGNQQTASVQISDLQRRVNIAEADIDSLEIKTATNAGSITSLNNRLSNAEALTRKVEDGSVVIDNTLSTLDTTSNKPVSGKGVAKAIEVASDSLKARGYIYMGVATPTTTPDVSGGKVFYLAAQAGKYNNFNITVPTDALTSLEWNGERWFAIRIADLVTPAEVESIAKTEVAKITPAIPRTNWSDAESIAIPVPQRGIVNIIADSLPTTKTANIKGELEFWDMEGNYFKKCIILNAQGTSSLNNAKKNFGIDIVGSDWDEDAPQVIKFGNWVAQDSFHLKAYMLDGIRIKSLVGYDLYESILLSRAYTNNRAWKRALLPSEVPSTGNYISEADVQLDTGAKGHPAGFPIVVYHNSAFYGIYCWQIKKHRDNYHQDKSNPLHIHLDGNISNALLWSANGNIDWDKWAGKTPSEGNADGIEIRNPKKLILADGTVYDADVNNGELISADSPLYDASNEDMVRTASVRSAIELLSTEVARINALSGDEQKSELAKILDIDSVIDYFIFSNVVANNDGWKKNWQWTTYDGVKWSVNAYDLDGIFGWSSFDWIAPYKSTYYYGDSVIMNMFRSNFLKEVKARYQYLRASGIISTEAIMRRLSHYIRVIGIDIYEKEYESWDSQGGVRDNIWRFQKWIESQIATIDSVFNWGKGNEIFDNVYYTLGATRVGDTGYWSLNGITDLTEENMMHIYMSNSLITRNAPYTANQYSMYQGRTIIAPNHGGGIANNKSSLYQAFYNAANLEVLPVSPSGGFRSVNSMTYAFYGCKNLRSITGVLDVSSITSYSSTFTNCTSLETVKLKGLKANLSLSASSNISKESILYAINNAGSEAITITLHSEAYSRLVEDAEIVEALANKSNISLASA